MIDEGDDTLSLSFVDCVSCGLAATLFLLIIFGAVPHTALSKLGKSSGSQVVYDETQGSPLADIEIFFEDVSFSPNEGVWTQGGQRVIFADAGRSFSYFKEFKSGIRSTDKLEFSVPARGLVRGHIYFHAGGRTVKTTFDCSGKRATGDRWIIVQRFDLRTRKAVGDCILGQS